MDAIMKIEYRDLRLKQLAAALGTFGDAKQTPRPRGGWLRAFREALGVSQLKVAELMHVKQQSIVSFEKAEAEDRITLRNLRRVAEAMGCELVYAIVPKSGTIQELAERRARNEATKRVLSVEHTMALEDQAAGGVENLIDEETKRTAKKS
jgi:predicted DNA-binding mobile mystery protein A